MNYLKNLLFLLSFSLIFVSCDDDDSNPEPAPYPNYLKVGNNYFELDAAQAMYDEEDPSLFSLWMLKEDGDDKIMLEYLRSTGEEEEEIATGNYTYNDPEGEEDPEEYEEGKFQYVYTQYMLNNTEHTLESTENAVSEGNADIKQLPGGLYEIKFKIKFNGQTVEGYYKGEVEFTEGW